MTYYQIIYILSIDIKRRKVIFIFLSTLSKKSEVIAFLEELSTVLQSNDFNIDTDLVIIRKNKEQPKEIYFMRIISLCKRQNEISIFVNGIVRR